MKFAALLKLCSRSRGYQDKHAVIMMLTPREPAFGYSWITATLIVGATISINRSQIVLCIPVVVPKVKWVGKVHMSEDGVMSLSRS